MQDFYSRPCGRGDCGEDLAAAGIDLISTHAPAGGATKGIRVAVSAGSDFYSRPCGRGDRSDRISILQ